ncbi:MAG: competence protein [Alistipes sp.]|nr:competence protein [Alistipes sp.]
MKKITAYYLVFTLLLSAFSVSAQTDTTAVDSVVTELEAPTPEVLWDRANTAYINDHFAEAIATYETLVAEGYHSPQLYYNLANAYFKREELGAAILNYHRALRMAPGDEDIRHNLSVAEARTKDTIDRIPEFFLSSWFAAFSGVMNSTAWTILSLVLLAALFAMLLFYLLAQRLAVRKAGFYATVALLMAFLLTIWCAVEQREAQLDASSAVVMSASAAVKSSPDRSATDLFVLHEGTVVEVTNSLDAWREVVIADGKKGWIEARKIEVI